MANAPSQPKWLKAARILADGKRHSSNGPLAKTGYLPSFRKLKSRHGLAFTATKAPSGETWYQLKPSALKKAQKLVSN